MTVALQLRVADRRHCACRNRTAPQDLEADRAMATARRNETETDEEALSVRSRTRIAVNVADFAVEAERVRFARFTSVAVLPAPAVFVLFVRFVRVLTSVTTADRVAPTARRSDTAMVSDAVSVFTRLIVLVSVALAAMLADRVGLAWRTSVATADRLALRMIDVRLTTMADSAFETDRLQLVERRSVAERLTLAESVSG